MVVHVGGSVVTIASGGVGVGVGAPPMLAPPAPLLPVPLPVTGPDPSRGAVPEPPEHVAVTLGWHANRVSPQATSVLQGNCHRNAHADVVTLLQVGGVVVTGGGGSHLVLAGHGATAPAGAVPPLQVEMVCA